MNEWKEYGTAASGSSFVIVKVVRLIPNLLLHDKMAILAYPAEAKRRK